MKSVVRLPVPWLMLPILLVGAALRLVGINNGSPPGLEHDEVANWLIDRAILAGEHAIYFTEAYGHEAGFHYVQATLVALIGDNALALRLPAAFMGLMGIAVTFLLARHLFGLRVAVTSGALLAVLFFPIFYSRLGLRAIMLPLLSGLSAYFWWRGWGVETTDWRLGAAARNAPTPLHLQSSTFTGSHATWTMTLAGLFAGLSLHSYMAARAVPIFYALFLMGLALIRPATLKARWRQVFLFWLVMALVASPLVAYLLTNPEAEFRIGEIDAPLRALWQGDLRPIVDNSVDILGAFGFAGDPLWRQNVASMPIFEPLLATFFYACLGLSLLYVRDSRYLFLILWLLTATIPSIVTIDAPSSIRIINILPVLTILPAIVIHNLGHLSTKIGWLSTAPVDKWGIPLLVVLLITFHVIRSAQAIFVTWPANEEVRFVWQEALTDAAEYLDRWPEVRDVGVGGWTPDTMDSPSMDLALRRDDLSLRYFDPQWSLLIPAPTAEGLRVIVRPAILPVDRALRAPLQTAAVVSDTAGSFVYYTIQQTPEVAPQSVAAVEFGGEIEFMGYTLAVTCFQSDGTNPCVIVTYWRVLQPPPDNRRIFLHVVDKEGSVIADGDGLGAPPAFWRRGDIFLQKHEIPSESMVGSDAMRLGIYDPQSGRRLLTNASEQFVILQFAVTE